VLIAPADAAVGSDTGPSSNVLFRDDFSGGYAANWLLSVSDDGLVTDSAEAGNPNVTLDATGHKYTRLHGNLDGSLFTNSDIAASLRFKVAQAPAGSRSVRLDVRQASSTENIFYAVGATITKDGTIPKVGIFKKVDDGNSSYTICALAESELGAPVSAAPWRSLKLTISGRSTVHLTAYFDGTPLVTFVDDCTSSLTSTAGNTVPNGGCLADQTALGIQIEEDIVAAVDDVLVTAL
jgi:hypothetical protein